MDDFNGTNDNGTWDDDEMAAYAEEFGPEAGDDGEDEA
jgi:hypothetical protein